jgi:hypothetical protein
MPRAACREDIGQLYRLASESRPGWFRLSAGEVPPPDRFWGLLQHEQVHQIVVEDPDDLIVAYAALYRGDSASGRVMLDVAAAPGPTEKEHRDAAVRAILKDAFANWSFEKVLSVTHGFEPHPFSGVSAWTEEGRLRECFWFGEKYWDRVYLACYRDQWARSSEAA